MGNCLKTQLKQDVNNDNLTKYGYFPINIIRKDGVSYSNLSLKKEPTVGSIIVEVVGNGYFSTTVAGLDDPASCLTQIEHTTNTTLDLYLPNEDFKIIINSRYAAIKEIMFNQSKGLALNISDIKYNPSIETLSLFNSSSFGDITGAEFLKNVNQISVYNTEITGNIDNIANNTQLTFAVFSYLEGITGNISSFSKSINLGTLFLSNTAINGTVEDLCEKQIQNGRSSGTITLRCSTNVSLHNVTGESREYSIVFGSNSCTISLGGNQVASYNGSTWTYNS